MKRASFAIAALLATSFLIGCSGGSAQDDSMSPMLEQAKKDQGVSGTDVKGKDSPNLKAPPESAGTTGAATDKDKATPPPGKPGGDKGK